MELTAALEAILFVTGSPVELPRLTRALARESAEVNRALDALARRYEATSAGLRLLRSPEGVQLVTAADVQKAVEGFVTATMRERLTPVAAETLAIIAYRGPVSRAAIEAIRGVNSSFTLRLLALRGLVVRQPHPHDGRSFVYEVSSEFLRHLGVTAVEDLPDYHTLHLHAGMTKLTAETEGSASGVVVPASRTPAGDASSSEAREAAR